MATPAKTSEFLVQMLCNVKNLGKCCAMLRNRLAVRPYSKCTVQCVQRVSITQQLKMHDGR